MCTFECELVDTSVMSDGWSFGNELIVHECTCNNADKMHTAVREHVATILQFARLACLPLICVLLFDCFCLVCPKC